jgi:hypothetical protein
MRLLPKNRSRNSKVRIFGTESPKSRADSGRPPKHAKKSKFSLGAPLGPNGESAQAGIRLGYAPPRDLSIGKNRIVFAPWAKKLCIQNEAKIGRNS